MRPFIVVLLIHSSACTVESPWGVEGRSGHPCFPEATCDEGLTCSAGMCGSSGCTLDTQLVVETVPSATMHDRAVIRGRVGPEATEIVVSTGKAIERIPAGDGSFCVEVPLTEGAQTQISVVAHNNDGCVSAPQLFGVTHNPHGTNVVAGLTPRGPWPRVNNLTDGSLTTAMQFSFKDERDPPDAEVCDTYTYLWFAFDQPQRLHRLIVHYPDRRDFEQYILCWSLLYSSDANPGVPFPSDSEEWSHIGQSAEGQADGLVYDFKSVVEANHIALLVYEDGKRGDTESFEIAEIEVFSPPTEDPFVGCR